MPRTFIGRTEQLEALRAQLGRGADVVYIDFAQGIHGIGKSALLDRFQEIGRDELGRLVLRLSMQLYVPAAAVKDDTVNDSLLENFARYRDLLKAVADGLPNRNPEFTAELDRHRSAVTNVEINVKNDFKIGAFARVRDISAQNQNFAMQLGAMRAAAVRDSVDVLNAKLAELLEPWGTPERPLLLLVDEFESVMDTQVGAWFLRLAVLFRNAVAVITKDQFADELGETVTRWRLPNFTLEETAACLRDGLTRETLPPDLLEAVQEFSGGHPQAVWLAIEWLKHQDLDQADHSAWLDALLALTGDLATNMNKLVSQIIDDVEDPDLKEVLSRLWILRRFDADAIRHLAAELVPDSRKAGDEWLLRMLDALEQYSFVEKFEFDGRTMYRFHEYLRQERDRYLARDRVLYEALHDRARDYYSTLLNQYDETKAPAKSYAGWYRYEQPAWQALKLEWLYHVNHLTRDRSAAMLDFTRLFLDAFWWWGSYIHFDFCDRILDDWEESGVVEDKPWIQALQELHESYPIRWPWSDHPDWSKVEDSLWTVRELAQLEGDVGGLDEQHRHLRALTNLFLADAVDQNRPGDAESDRLYDDAEALFKANEDTWNLSWARYSRGAHDARLKRPKQALELCHDALQSALSDDVDDPELAALACACMAHVALADGPSYNQAWDFSQRALFHAYEFQVKPHPPDLYTQHLYMDVVGQVVEIVISARKTAAAEAAKGCQSLHDLFAGYWPASGAAAPAASLETWLATAGEADVQAFIAPMAVPDDALNTMESDYYRRARRVVRALRPGVVERAARVPA